MNVVSCFLHDQVCVLRRSMCAENLQPSASSLNSCSPLARRSRWVRQLKLSCLRHPIWKTRSIWVKVIFKCGFKSQITGCFILGFIMRKWFIMLKKVNACFFYSCLFLTFKVRNYKRLTPFSVSDHAVENLDNLKPGDCIVCFSKNDIYSVSRQIEIRGLECAVIYGSLPPGESLYATKFRAYKLFYILISESCFTAVCV